MNATIELLPFFTAVAEAGSFTAAAGALGETKSRVSRAVARLEDQLGTELFHRTTRAVALTTSGAALLERAGPLLAALREAVGTLPEREEFPTGELRVTAPADLGALLADVIARYTLRYPNTSVDLCLTNRRVDLVREGYDLAIRAAAGRLTPSTLIARRLCAVEAQLYASPSYLARRGLPREVGDPAHDWVLFLPSATALHLPKGTIPRLRCDDLLFVRDALRTGIGVGWLPWFLAEPALKAGELSRVLPSWRGGGGSIYLLYPPRKRQPRKIPAFCELLGEAVRQRPLTG